MMHCILKLKMATPNNVRWTEREVLNLIAIYEENYNRFEGTVTVNDIYRDITLLSAENKIYRTIAQKQDVTYLP